ncbi:NAD(P)H-dependent oxidoreductase [Frankia sp. Mgl5]|uniref:NADPH-dependent FMN reductase n=1 Tax=Frankia sp. Mgl5 TaxID=2933793 RepID=UPI00200C851B|nr:NAD(P)H-dependent oxidoreductase [Frankia sp. Mgl5]MCK9928305.1 NAD(P)H-dependent oxidoreductase [Frankia sp. Mgl5]
MSDLTISNQRAATEAGPADTPPGAAEHTPDITPLRVAVVLASVRAARFGPVVAGWFARRAGQRPDVTVDVVDLAGIGGIGGVDTAVVDTAEVDPMTWESFADRIAAADAVVIVTPEYNHSFPGPLKTAVDALGRQWHAKPVAFVSYGGMSGGLRAVEALRVVFAELHAVTIRDTVSFHNAWSRFGADGEPLDPGPVNGAATALLDQLCWWGSALRDKRRTHPYQR